MCLLIKFSKVNKYQEFDHELWIGKYIKILDVVKEFLKK